MSPDESGVGTHVFYLDEIRFRGDYTGRPCFPMLRSYDTGNLYIHNAAFSYDNALAAMAFLSAGRTCIRCSQTVRMHDWGGWMFLNGWLPEGETVPQLNDEIGRAHV